MHFANIIANLPVLTLAGSPTLLDRLTPAVALALGFAAVRWLSARLQAKRNAAGTAPKQAGRTSFGDDFGSAPGVPVELDDGPCMVSGTDYAFVNELLEMGKRDEPAIGETLHIDASTEDDTLGEIPVGEATVVAVEDECMTIRSAIDGRTYETNVEAYLLASRSPALDAMVQKHAERTDPDGVAFSDTCVPDALADALRTHVQRLKEEISVDYHPGSGTRVRDLVHPSLYPFVEGKSQSTAPLPSPASPKHDRFGRPFEGSRYQWLPTPFRIDASGTTHIESYINNLDGDRYSAVYDDLARLFSAALPMLEGVLGYVHQTRFWQEDCADVEHEGELPTIDTTERVAVRARKMRGTELLVIPKIVEYRLAAGETHEGVWHVEGMSHEHIVATCVYVLDRDTHLDGGALQFKRAYTVEEAGRLFWNIEQVRPTPVETLVEEGTIPVGQVATPRGRMLVFPNSHIHKLSALSVAGAAAEATRQVIVFWVVDPDVRIASTREIPQQQGIMSHDEALAIRLALMEERRLHKGSFNPRHVSLCEH